MYKNKPLTVLACPLPKSFTLKDSTGKYWCLDYDGHLHTEDRCRGSFKSENRHEFHAITGEYDYGVPNGKCAIQSAYDDSFLKTNGRRGQLGSQSSMPGGKLVQGDNNYLNDSDYHFIVTYVGADKLNIFSVGKGKYLRRDRIHAIANETSNCGVACQFIIEEEVSASTALESQGIPKKEI
jgi:hypothetical protein